MLVGPNLNTPDPERELRDVRAAAHASGHELIVVEASSDRDIETAFATIAQRGAGALFIGSSAFFNSRQGRVAALAVRHALPAANTLREFPAGRILKGEKPGDLPVMQPTKFEFVINLKTAKAARPRNTRQTVGTGR